MELGELVGMTPEIIQKVGALGEGGGEGLASPWRRYDRTQPVRQWVVRSADAAVQMARLRLCRLL